MSSPWRGISRRIIGLSLPFLVMGCLNETLGGPTPVIDNTAALGSVSVWPHAIMLARDSSQQLVVTAKAYDGTLLSGAVSTFESSNDTLVSIDSTGLLTGRKAAPFNNVMIFIRSTYNGMSRYDTAVVRVTELPDSADRLLMAPETEAERHRTVNGYLFPASRVYRRDNTLLSNPLVWYEIMTPQSGTTVSGVPLAYIGFSKRGSIWIRGSAVIYGKELVDSTEYIIGDPALFSVYIYNFTGNDQTFGSASGYLAVNGRFSVINYAGRAITVTFSDPTAVTGGSSTVEADATGTWTFTKAGRYTWTSSTSPTIGGAIVVR